MKRPINFRESNAPLICCKSCFYGRPATVKNIDEYDLDCVLTFRLLKASNVCDHWKKKETSRTATAGNNDKATVTRQETASRSSDNRETLSLFG